ncbi:MAG: hypothetical protein RDU25_00945 [Patescibacteria group bacterium]|nr:hypothetical protein [Patescibacteria group bacterium]
MALAVEGPGPPTSETGSVGTGATTQPEVDDDIHWEASADGTQLETFRPGAVGSDGPHLDEWSTPPLDMAESTGADARNSSHGLAGVDAEVSSMVEVALAPQPTPQLRSATDDQPKSRLGALTDASEISATEIDLSELGDFDEGEPEPGIESENSSPNVIGKRPAPHIPDSVFDSAPRAPGASVPPDGRGSSVSFTVLSTLAELSGIVGRNLEELVDGLTEEDAEALRRLMLKGEWPGDEETTCRVIIRAMPVLNPLYKKHTRWTRDPPARLIRLFLEELDPPDDKDGKRAKSSEPKPAKNESLAKLAARLRKRPPPLPTTKKK